MIKNRVVHLKTSFLRGGYEALSSAIGQILSKNCWNYHLAFSDKFTKIIKSGIYPVFQTSQRLKFDLKTQIPLVQMLGETHWWPNFPVDYNYLRTPKGLKEIATYAVGIGPWILHIYLGKDKHQKPRFTSLVRDAHSKGLFVHPYMFHKDKLPKGIKDFNELLNIFYFQLGVDGVFTDFPDLVIQFLKNSNE